MKTIIAKVKDWWNQRIFESVRHTLMKEGRWNFNLTFIQEVHALILPRLDQLTYLEMRVHQVRFCRPNVDDFIYDLDTMGYAIRTRSAVPSNAVYVSAEEVSLYYFMSSYMGAPVSLKEAYLRFHQSAKDLETLVDALLSSDETSEISHYTRILAPMLTDVVGFYTLYLSLVGFPMSDQN